MKILVINSGSSSVKFQLLELPHGKLICSGLVEKLSTGLPSIRKYRSYKNVTPVETIMSLPPMDHAEALRIVVREMTEGPDKSIASADEIEVIGHRVLHGGEAFSNTTFINEQVVATIKKLLPLGPLHLPANLLGIEVCGKLFPNAKQAAVFDTAFHQTMPLVAYRYAVPKSYYEELGIRAYGFHGTSHKYVSDTAMAYLRNPSAKLIIAHLGNGCSISAIDSGKCIDTSMGLGPLGGLVMGSRCGDIDPSVFFHVLANGKVSVPELQETLNKKSGILGMCGHSDMRDVKKAIADGNPDAKIAYELYAYRIKKYIGSYVAVLGGLDAIVFTGGVGENDGDMRSLSLAGLNFLGIGYQQEPSIKGENGILEFQPLDYTIKTLVIPTNEELEIAKQCYDLSKKNH